MQFGLTPWIGMIAGAIVSTVLAVIISWPCFRLRGPFFALATIAVLEVVRLLVINQHDLTGGSVGLAVPLKLGAQWMLFRARWPYLLIAFYGAGPRGNPHAKALKACFVTDPRSIA
ncbi:Branched-chain amino acid ABC transporter ATP-binding protein [Pseudomonas amygdali pv. mellea]|uniref:hypothetical protein n=1 Tax=Pseudomonas amygdali TaxID=47877 RepID=UPI0006E5AF3E|nr:hypothetical protein [Pseudomonas amygdali]KPW27369.1 hypothetical protein ALO51_200022 [Pseudomonas amygdali]KPX84644.1 Branched-chain amino acid ABC transporter ATP-binding protein [Pseudomonas amygdali pv. mellea]